MPINFPSSPSANQLFQYNGNSYQWDGSKWRKTNIFSNSIVTEYTNKVEQTTSTVNIQPDKYDYHVLDITGDTTVSIPRATPNSSFVLEINYAASTGGYGIENASYDNVSFSVSSQDTGPNGLFFKPDGTKMYVVGTANWYVYQYSLSSAWDLNSASYDSVSFSVSSQGTVPIAIFFKDDGTKMYMVSFLDDTVYQYSLSSAWDLSSASYDSVSFGVSSQDGIPTDIFFKPDGTKMYMVGRGNDSVYQYSLSSAWDLSSASYDNVSFSVGSQDGNPLGLFFKPDGTKMYMLGNINDTVYQYSLVGETYSITWPSEFEFNENAAPLYGEAGSLILELYNSDNTTIYATEKFNNI